MGGLSTYVLTSNLMNSDHGIEKHRILNSERHTTEPHSSLEEGNNKAIREANKSAEQTVIDLDSSDSPDDPSLSEHTLGHRPSGSISKLIQKEVDSSDSDAEFRELAAKARERRRLKEQGQHQSIQHNETESAISLPTDQSEAPHDADSIYDPVIEILITSVIPNSKPLIVQRRLSQRLKEVRLAWCERQHFSPDFTDSVFFTWRNKRLYDVTTCKNFQFTGSGRKSRDSINDGEEITRVHLEAVTEETLAANKRNDNPKNHLDTGNGNQGNGKGSEEAKTQQLKVKVRAPGYEDHKLIVKPVSVSLRTSNFINAKCLDYFDIPTCQCISHSKSRTGREINNPYIRWRSITSRNDY